ncbi:hypothetical protein CJF32_00000774 [Rutstroemia sp. NJR-2017a WRK4]|nr:hypothetical protein CJF32_00000774 [Rutstroemia sp. NJR-2017a WRK4]
MEALTNLTQSIPDWNRRLDDLNGQIAQRQIELARLVDPKPARSIRNKGSTESLRPKDGEEFTSPINDSDNTAPTTPQDVGSPKSAQNGFTSQTRPESPSVARAAAAAALESNPPQPLTPRASPNALTRQSSQPTQPTKPRPANVLRKRKTESLASGGSQAPKYRTRSMIIVYYDSAVQTAFEELVKFVSGNRNAMRKGKMAAKMAEMRRAAEMEADEESSDDSEDDTSTPLGCVIPKPSLPNSTKANGHHSAENSNGDLTPKLNFVSTRQMGPPRDRVGRDNIGNTMNMLKGYRRAGGVSPGAALDIFDELDKGLEWCQSQCEHAAHQFLRDGDCSTEIENIKQKLQEVKEAAEKKLEKLAAEEKEEREREEQKEKERLLKPVKQPIVKIAPAPVQRADIPLNLEVDDSMEVDDEEDDVDVDFDPRKLIFKRSRDVAY